MTQIDMLDQEYLFWSAEHGEVFLFARDADQAWEKFYEEHSGNGDYEVVVAEIHRCPKCDFPSGETRNITDSWGADLYSCHVCDDCGEQFGGDLNDA